MLDLNLTRNRKLLVNGFQKWGRLQTRKTKGCEGEPKKTQTTEHDTPPDQSMTTSQTVLLKRAQVRVSGYVPHLSNL